MAKPKVTKDNPLEVWEGGGWTWKVIGKYTFKGPKEDQPFARWFCFVTSPYCPDGEYGDVYVAEIKRAATKVVPESGVVPLLGGNLRIIKV